MSKSTLYIVASLAGLYIADVEFNQGRTVDTIGLYNWNKPQFQYSNQLQEKVNSLSDNVGNSYQTGKDAIQDTLNKLPKSSEIKDKAIDVYNDAYSKLVSAQESVNAAVNSQAKDTKKEADKHLEEAKKHFEEAKNHLNSFGSDAIQEAQQKYHAAGNKVYNKLSDIASTSQDQLHNVGSYFVDKYKELYDAAGNLLVTSQEKAQELADYYDDEAKKAKKSYEETQASILHWRDAQSEAVQSKAKENYDYIISKRDKANAELNKWIEQTKKDASKKAENAQQSAINAKENVKENVNSAYNKANKEANKAYNYAADVKGDADQAALQAKENVKYNADNAKNYIVDAGQGAASYLKDKYNEVRDNLGRLTITSQEKAQEVADYYESQLKQAKKQYEDTQSSWIHWRKAKSSEIQAEAKKNYEYLLKRDEEARNELQKWVDQGKVNADAAAARVQNELSAANDDAQTALNDARGWLRR